MAAFGLTSRRAERPRMGISGLSASVLESGRSAFGLVVRVRRNLVNSGDFALPLALQFSKSLPNAHKMQANRPFAEFLDQQRAVLSVLNQARPLFNAAYDEAWPRLAEFRVELTARMRDFQRYKHDVIFDPIIQGNVGDRAIAAALKADCIALGIKYDSFRQQWAKADVQTNWPQYRLSAISMMTIIREAFLDQDARVRTLRAG